jgi:hypothetical protein
MKIKVYNHDADEESDGYQEFDTIQDFIDWINEWDSSLSVEVEE